LPIVVISAMVKRAGTRSPAPINDGKEQAPHVLERPNLVLDGADFRLGSPPNLDLAFVPSERQLQKFPDLG
jgi:hypothetical protein